MIGPGVPVDARAVAETHRDGKRCGECTGHSGCRAWDRAEAVLAAWVAEQSGTGEDILARWRQVRRRHGRWHGPGAPCSYCRRDGCWLDQHAREQLAAWEHRGLPATGEPR